MSDTSNLSKGKAYFIHDGLGLCLWRLGPVQAPRTPDSITLCWETQSRDDGTWTGELEQQPVHPMGCASGDLLPPS